MPTPAEQNLHDIARSFTTIGAKVAAASKPPPPVIVSLCWQCDGARYTEDGSRCYNCGGFGRVATQGGEP